MKPEIAILMATYNGALFLKEQIDSIINQTYKNWTLYFHDDGSSDETISIINEYCNKYSNIYFIEDDETHRGPEGSFSFLLKKIEAPYYMFSDQDDYWIPEKIEKSYNSICKFNEELPALVAANQEITDKNLRLLRTYSNIKSNLLSKKELMKAFCFFPGCTMIFNKVLRDLYNSEDNPFSILHDHKLTLVNLKYKGEFHYVKEPLIKYRQHDSNAVGSSVTNSSTNKFKRIKDIIRNWWMHYRVRKYYLNQSLIAYIKVYFIGKFLLVKDRMRYS